MLSRQVSDAVRSMAEGFTETRNNTNVCEKDTDNITRLTRRFYTFDGPLDPNENIDYIG